MYDVIRSTTPSDFLLLADVIELFRDASEQTTDMNKHGHPGPVSFARVRISF